MLLQLSTQSSIEEQKCDDPQSTSAYTLTCKDPKIQEFFLGNYSKGGPHCGIIIDIYRKGAQKNCTKTQPREHRRKKQKPLSVQLKQSRKRLLLVRLHSIGLQRSFIQKTSLPSMEVWQASVEDEIVSLLLNHPSSYHEDFSEERSRKLLLCRKHHAVRIKAEVSIDAQVSPALPTEVTSEEQMKNSFFPIF
jgi:hypothetical protein